jgi:ribosomal protein L15
MGSSGFKARGVPDKIISLRDLDKRDAGIINLSSEGYGKLLGSGDVTKKFDVVVAKFTAKAEQRIKEKGGSVKAE